MDQAPGEVEISLEPLWSLMRFLSLRLKPKAAATPSTGSGPGTEAAGPAGAGWEVLEVAHVRVSPSPVNPRAAG